jgi:nitrite reductase/ring-hydroxylating ferredoxin subunit
VSETWHPVADASKLYPGEICVVRIGWEEYALANVGGRFYATSNRCPHQGGSLGDGFLEGRKVTCPLHGWEFDVETGLAAHPMQPGKIRCYATKVEDGKVWIQLTD